MSNRILILVFIMLFFIKILAIYFTNFDLFGDEAQYWLWSKDLNFGYFSKPPLLAWFINVHTALFGDLFFSLKIFPSIVYFLIGISIYSLCKKIELNSYDSVYCSLLFLIIPAVSFSSYIVSTDLLLLLFWTISLNILFQIKKRPSLISFLILGIMIGLAFLSKYAAVYFLICFFIYLLLDKGIRKIVIKNYFGTTLCLLSILIVVLPNILWNINNDWITFNHTTDNANWKNIDISILRGLLFLLIQVFMIGPFLVVAAVLNYKYFKINPNNKLLLVFSLPIFLIVFVEAVIVRANANWAAPAMIAFFLFLITNLVKYRNIYLKINFFFNVFFCLIFFLLIGFSYPADIFKRISGINKFANEIHQIGIKSDIKDIVISDRLLFSSFSYELREKKLNFHMPHKPNSKITNHFKITSALKQKMDVNFILLGDLADINYLSKDYFVTKRTITNEGFINREISVYEIIFN